MKKSKTTKQVEATEENFISTQLEVYHRDGGVVVYAYFHTKPTKADWKKAVESNCEGDIGLIREDAEKWEDREEVPTNLTEKVGIRRYYLGGAG